MQRGGKKHVTMQEWASRLAISVKVFGFRKAMRLAASYSGLLGGAGKNVDSLESDVLEVQRLLASQGKEKRGKSGVVARGEVASRGERLGDVQGALSTDSSKVIEDGGKEQIDVKDTDEPTLEDGGKEKIDVKDTDEPTRVGSSSRGGEDAKGEDKGRKKEKEKEKEKKEKKEKKEDKEEEFHSPRPIAPAVQGGEGLENNGRPGDDGKEVVVTTSEDREADDMADAHKECGVWGEDGAMSMTSGRTKEKGVSSPDALGDCETSGDAVVEDKKPRDPVEELSESLKAQVRSVVQRATWCLLI